MKAICIECGNTKESAWQQCPGCKFNPADEDAKAKSLLLSTHFNNEHKLSQFSSHLKKGKAIDYKPKDLDMVKNIIHQKHSSKSAQQKHILKLIACFLLTIVLMVAITTSG